MPDFVCSWGGRFLAIEAKAPGKLWNVSALQQMQIAAIAESGGRVLVVDDVAMLDVLDKEFGAIQ